MSTLEETCLELSDKHEELVVKLMTDIRNGKLDRSDKVALATLSVLEEIINDFTEEDPMRCVEALRAATRRVRGSVSAAGVARRLLREYRAAHHKDCGGAWLRALVAPPPARPAPAPLAASAVPSAADCDTSPLGDASPLADYLREARCEVEGGAGGAGGAGGVWAGATLVCPRAALAAPAPPPAATVLLPAMPQWERACAALASAGARVCVLPTAAALRLMPALHKVVVWGAGGAGGAARAARGSRALAAAAARHNVPVLVLCPLQQLCPTHLQPANGGGGGEEEEWDVIPADLITLFVTNIGCISPSYMYRLMSELYDPSDYDL